MKITTGLYVWYRGRHVSMRVQFSNNVATAISGHTLDRISGLAPITVSDETFDAVFSDYYNSAANASRALALFGVA